MPSIRLAAVALLLCAPVAAHAAEDATPTAAQTAEADAQPEKPKKICRMETSTGSVMPRRVCRTPEQVEAGQRAAERTREQLERQRGSL